VAVAVVDIQVNAGGASQQLRNLNQQSQQLQTAVNGATTAVTRQGRELQTAANGMKYFTDAAGRARAENGRLLTTAERAAAGIRNQGQVAERAGIQLDGFTQRIAGIGLALAGGFAVDRVIRDATELDRNIRRLGTVGMDIEKINPALSKLSDQLGGVANKADLAAASYQAASAGFADTAGNIQILDAATRAAVGGLADTQAVTEVLVKTLNAYGMSGTRAFEVTDSISKAVELGNQEWSDYTSLLGRVVSTTSLAGVSINEMNAFIASATKNGATAEVAFTGLGAVLNTLLQPTKESQDAAKKLGIAWNYGGLQAKGFTGLMAQLAVAMQKDKETTARLLGSQEAMRGAFAANAKGGKDFVMVLEQLSGAAGKTDADFQTMKGSLENTIKALDTSFINLSEALAKAFGPTVVITIQDITKSVNGFANVMSSIPQPVMDAVGTLIKFGIQMMLVKRAIDAVIALRAAYVAATTAMAASTAATGTAATASSGAFALYTRNSQALATQSAASATQVTALGTALRGLAAIGIITVGVNIIVSGTADLIATIKEVNKLRGERESGGVARIFGGSATAEQKAAAAKTLAQIRAERESMAQPGAQATRLALGAFSPLVGQPSQADVMNRQLLFSERERKARAVLALPTRAARPATTTPPPATDTTPPPTVGGAGSGKAKDGDSKAAAAKAALATSQLQLSQARALFDVEGRILEARGSGNRQLEITRQAQAELLRITFEAQRLKVDKEMPAAQKKAELDQLAIKAATTARQLEFDINTIRKEDADLKAQGIQALNDELALQQARLNGNEAEVILNQQIRDLKAQFPGLNEADIRTTLAKTKALKAQADAAEQLKQVYADIGMSIKSGVVDAIQGAIDGTKSLQQVAVDLLNSIANKLLDIAVNMALFGTMSGTGTGGGLLGPLFRANGGSVSSGQPYIVGEKGPELFMPGRSGTIIPNHNLGGGGTTVIVNVDASGSSVSGDQAQGKQLGMAVSAAVQAELIKQKRPGGLLA
jgi:TP901 family phage tail tape measure protein